MKGQNSVPCFRRNRQQTDGGAEALMPSVSRRNVGFKNLCSDPGNLLFLFGNPIVLPACFLENQDQYRPGYCDGEIHCPWTNVLLALLLLQRPAEKI
jgi:hypothetical protein